MAASWFPILCAVSKPRRSAVYPPIQKASFLFI
nr:MAG TPA: hypothetical protein [Caudoviricetes sp.]